jgi:hypothetical protein
MPPPPPPPPELLEDVIGEILLRLSPDEPAYLVRASLVCKLWYCIVSDRSFLRHYRKRSLYRELGSVPRARSQALGTETLCRELRVQLSAQKQPAVQTYCAEREQSRLSAQTSTHGTEDLCRER